MQLDLVQARLRAGVVFERGEGRQRRLEVSKVIATAAGGRVAEDGVGTMNLPVLCYRW